MKRIRDEPIPLAIIQSALIEGFALVRTVKLPFSTAKLPSQLPSSFVVLFTSCYEPALNASNIGSKLHSRTPALITTTFPTIMISRRRGMVNYATFSMSRVCTLTNDRWLSAARLSISHLQQLHQITHRIDGYSSPGMLARNDRLTIVALNIDA